MLETKIVHINYPKLQYVSLLKCVPVVGGAVYHVTKYDFGFKLAV